MNQKQTGMEWSLFVRNVQRNAVAYFCQERSPPSCRQSVDTKIVTFSDKILNKSGHWSKSEREREMPWMEEGVKKLFSSKRIENGVRRRKRTKERERKRERDVLYTVFKPFWNRVEVEVLGFKFDPIYIPQIFRHPIGWGLELFIKKWTRLGESRDDVVVVGGDGGEVVNILMYKMSTK